MLGMGWVEPFGLPPDSLSELHVPADGLNGYSREPCCAPAASAGSFSRCRWCWTTRFGIARRDILAKAATAGRPPAWLSCASTRSGLTQRDSGGKLLRAGLDVQSLDPRQLFETVLFAFGGDLFRDGKPAFNDPTGVAALQWLTGLQLRDRVIDQGFSSPKATTLPIADGRAAMAIGHNNWWVTTTKQRPEVIDQLQPFLLNPAKPSIFAGGTLVSVSAASRHQSAAQAPRPVHGQPGRSHWPGPRRRGSACAGPARAVALRAGPEARTGPLRAGQPALRQGRGRDPGLACHCATSCSPPCSWPPPGADPKAALDALAVTANSAIADFERADDHR